MKAMDFLVANWQFLVSVVAPVLLSGAPYVVSQAAPSTTAMQGGAQTWTDNKSISITDIRGDVSIRDSNNTMTTINTTHIHHSSSSSTATLGDDKDQQIALAIGVAAAFGLTAAIFILHYDVVLAFTSVLLASSLVMKMGMRKFGARTISADASSDLLVVVAGLFITGASYLVLTSDAGASSMPTIQTMWQSSTSGAAVKLWLSLQEHCPYLVFSTFLGACLIVMNAAVLVDRFHQLRAARAAIPQAVGLSRLTYASMIVATILLVVLTADLLFVFL